VATPKQSQSYGTTPCQQEGTSYKIKVTYGVEIPGMTPAVSDTRETTVDVKHECQVMVPSDGEAHEVRLMNSGVCQPAVLMIRPIKIGDVDVKKAEDLKGLALEYSTILRDGYKDQDRKPIRGTHVFANGMAEWVTDMAAEGSPDNGDLVPVKDKNGNPTGRRAVTLLIFVGYSPLPSPTQQQQQQQGKSHGASRS